MTEFSTNALLSETLERIMACELEEVLGYERCDRISRASEVRNYRNGYSERVLRFTSGMIRVRIPRDRMGLYEPRILNRYQRDARGLEYDVMRLIACDLARGDLAGQFLHLYRGRIDRHTAERYARKLRLDIGAWLKRPLSEQYKVIWIRMIPFCGLSTNQTAIGLVGLTHAGSFDVLGVYIPSSASGWDWFQMFAELFYRGVRKIDTLYAKDAEGMRRAARYRFPDIRFLTVC